MRSDCLCEEATCKVQGTATASTSTPTRGKKKERPRYCLPVSAAVPSFVFIQWSVVPRPGGRSSQLERAPLRPSAARGLAYARPLKTGSRRRRLPRSSTLSRPQQQHSPPPFSSLDPMLLLSEQPPT